ncbi:hypothetical protein ACRALDRAFT_2134257 [Sodiomyces alcalophilus JCM 7366]|uniref:uncharacterized protein n=1 Tax=Sodiomyces alcalophilus JCM 7366 TaxID=591952 RepID=UPI0039B61C6C
MRWSEAFVALLLPLGTLAAAAPALFSKCSQVSFQISATAQNTVWLSPPNPNDEASVLDFFYSGLANGTGPAVVGTKPVSGTFTLNGVYCRPWIENKFGALQVLVHGISYNKTMWSGLGFGVQYDWHTFANAQGYHTLAIDRLGHGSNGQFPDPLEVVQGSLQVEIMHQLINVVRTERRSPLGRTFNTVIYVSHSYGGWVGNGLVTRYPQDVDAMVLTGYSGAPNFSVFADYQLRSASLLAPNRFPNVPLGYITFGQRAQREAAFYAGRYDPAIPKMDFAFQDTWTIGETGNLDFTFTPPVDYTGALFITTGVQDHIFCQTPRSACEALLQATRGFYPSVSSFGYFAPENTGHDLTLHYSAPLTFAKVHAFLYKHLSNAKA